MGFGFLFGSHARSMGCGRHHRAVALTSPTKAIFIIAYRVGKSRQIFQEISDKSPINRDRWDRCATTNRCVPHHIPRMYRLGNLYPRGVQRSGRSDLWSGDIVGFHGSPFNPTYGLQTGAVGNRTYRAGDSYTIFLSETVFFQPAV